MKMFKSPAEMSVWSETSKRSGQTIGFVPTMGFLHEGHASLIRLARQQFDRVVVSIFVNPTQFGPREDFDRYPREEEGDAALCRDEGVDVMFCPDIPDMYPADYSTWVTEETLSQGLCGASRPGHFRGVATVVTKLFNLVQPDGAVFGEKDGQQLRVIRRMVRDLNIPVVILSGPTLREPDGLAMSSRNKLLSPPERQQAALVHQSLQRAAAVFRAGERDAKNIKASVNEILNQAALGRVDYIDVVDDESLRPVDRIERTALLAVAVYFSSTRLIDNIVLNPG